jgi:hypothetical protein
MWKYIFGLIVLGGVVGTAAAWVMAGNAPGPSLQFLAPTAVGRTGEMVLEIETPGGELAGLEVSLNQRDDSIELFELGVSSSAELVAEADDRLILRVPIGREQFESLVEGEATLTARAVRPLLFGYRQAESSVSHTFEVRLRPPIINVQSQFHYINHGGTEMVVYRVSPAAEETGVFVGEDVYPGFPASGAGIAGAAALDDRAQWRHRALDGDASEMGLEFRRYVGRIRRRRRARGRDRAVDEHQHVEVGVEIAGVEALRKHPLEGKLELLENPARPPRLHRAAVAIPEPHARLAER